jgi:hypothetical protein
MEKIEQKIEAQNMGENTSRVFSGEAVSKAAQETYTETQKNFCRRDKKTVGIQ